MMKRIALAFVLALVVVTALARSGLPGNNPALHPPGALSCAGSIIDQLTTKPSAAYGLRRLSCAYLGPLIQIYRVSDGLTRDIGPAAGLTLNTAAITPFCAGTTCNLSRWYDQSGHGRDEICGGGAFTTCPQIWASGAYSATINARPAVLANGTFNTGMEYNPGGGDTNIVGTNAGALFGVASTPSGAAGNATASWWALAILINVNTVAISNSNTAFLGGFVQGGALYSPPSFNAGRYAGQWLGSPTDMFATKSSYVYGSAGTLALRWNTSDPTPTKVYLDGGTPATNGITAANEPSGLLCYPNWGASGCQGFSASFAGATSEGYAFLTEPSLVDSNLLGNDIATWYSLTWTNITL